jgi:hypothetical protein
MVVVLVLANNGLYKLMDKEDQGKPATKENKKVIRPPKPFKEMTIEEHQAWMCQVSGGRL